MAGVARVEIRIVLEGEGPENERTKVATFHAPEKIKELRRADPGVVGALLRGELDERRG